MNECKCMICKKWLAGIYLLASILFILPVYARDLKIVALSPHLTELVFALKKSKILVANTIQCDYPGDAKKINKIGSYSSPDLEKIVNINPDIILATEGNSKSTLDNLRRLKLNVQEFSPKNIDELKADILRLGVLLNAEKEAQELEKKIAQKWESLTKINPGKNRKILISLQLEPIYAVGPDTWLGDLFAQAQFQNTINAGPLKYPVVGEEYILGNLPEILFLMSSKLARSENMSAIKKFEKIFPSSLKTPQIKFLDADIFVRPGPRIVDAIDYLLAL